MPSVIVVKVLWLSFVHQHPRQRYPHWHRWCPHKSIGAALTDGYQQLFLYFATAAVIPNNVIVCRAAQHLWAQG